MKKTINHFVAIALSIVLSIPAARAADKDSTTISATLEFVGKINDQPVFKLIVLNKTKADDLTITVTDDHGYVFAENTLEPTTHSLRFVLSDDVKNVPLHFSIYDKATKKTVVYNVNRRFRVDENFDVTKL